MRRPSREMGYFERSIRRLKECFLSLGDAQEAGLLVMNRGFSRFAHVVGLVCLGGAALEVVGYQQARPGADVWPALFPLVGIIILLVILEFRRTNAWAVAYLVVGTAGAFWFAVTLFQAIPTLDETNAEPISLVKASLILVGGAGYSARSSIIWCFLGFAVGELAAVTAALLTPARWVGDITTTSVEIALLLIFITVSLTSARLLRARPRIDRAAIDDEVSTIRRRIEVRAAALMHDTVLSHLAAVAHADDGVLPEDLRTEVSQDLDVLMGENWLSEASPEPLADGRPDWRNSALFIAVQQSRDESLIVDVTGDVSAASRLAWEVDAAVGLAVRQCLVNVMRHADVGRAEVVVIGSDDTISVMVIDAGRGFAGSQVGADRLGLRQSVLRRIELVGGRVRVWSTPGRGTSVMISVPAARHANSMAAVRDD
jgi:signal transduction histidine kinase